MPDYTVLKVTGGSELQAEAMVGGNTNEARQIVSVGEQPLGLANVRGSLFGMTNADRTKTIKGTTTYTVTSPILILTHSGLDFRAVIHKLWLWVANTPGADVKIEASIEAATDRYVSGGASNLYAHSLADSGLRSSLLTVYEANNGAAIVASSGEGNKIRHAYCDNVLATKIELFGEGNLILPTRNSCLIVWAYSATTEPEFWYELAFEERPF